MTPNLATVPSVITRRPGMIQPVVNWAPTSATVTQWKLFAPGSYPRC
jgi:hypothetical protein